MKTIRKTHLKLSQARRVKPSKKLIWLLHRKSCWKRFVRSLTQSISLLTPVSCMKSLSTRMRVQAKNSGMPTWISLSLVMTKIWSAQIVLTWELWPRSKEHSTSRRMGQSLIVMLEMRELTTMTSRVQTDQLWEHTLQETRISCRQVSKIGCHSWVRTDSKISHFCWLSWRCKIICLIKQKFLFLSI